MQTALCRPNGKQETEKNIPYTYIYPQLAIKIVCLKKRKIGYEKKKLTVAGGDAKHITCRLYFTYFYNTSIKIVTALDFFLYNSWTN